MTLFSRFILILFLCFQTTILFAQSPAVAALDLTVPAAPNLEAEAYFLQDFHTGKVLAESNADKRLPPASLTKIMTVYVVFREISGGRLRLDDVATVSQKARETTGSRMYLEINSQVKIEELLKGVIIQSGNDASVALAEHIAGSEETFAELMNQQAIRLGMTNTHFMNADGLPNADHYTSARDLATLTRALIKEFPEYYKWFSQQSFTYNNITQQNRNLLLGRDETVDGVKTGFTEEAGYCLVASALREDMRLVSVVLHTKSAIARARENQTLLNYGYRFYESHRLYEGNKALQDVRIWKGRSQIVHLGLTEDLYVIIPRRQYKSLKAVMVVDKKITAPVKRGDVFGKLKVSLQEGELFDKNLVALESVESGNIFRRLYDSVLLMMEKSEDGK